MNIRTRSLLIVAIAFSVSACQTDEPGSIGAAYAAAVTPPASCGSSDPTCAVAQDFPTGADLTQSNSANLGYSSASNGLQLIGGSGNIVDSDGDDVPDPADECPGPGWRIPCDGDASNDGLYQTTYYGLAGEYTLGADIKADGKIRTADVYILMDATGSMVGEQVQLVNDLISGTFIDPGDCATAADTGLTGALKCVVDDVWMGLGQFNEVPLSPHGHPYGYTPYHHHLDVTNDLQHLLDGVSALTTTSNVDNPEAATQAMYSVATGQGLGPWVPNRQGCPVGRWGYPCFRPGALPVIMLFTDAEMYNGPRTGSPKYKDPPFNGTVGLATRLPPLEQDPAMLYSSDALSAHNLGDLSNKSVSVMGSNVNFGNDFTTRTVGTCKRCSGSTCWTDGYDGVVRFSLSSARSTFVSGEGSFYPYTNLALLDSSLAFLDCNRGPGGSDYWGRMTKSLSAGTWYAVADAAVEPSSSAKSHKGPFQIRIQTTADDPSWETKRLPITWTEVETELLARAIKVVSIVSPGNDGLVGEADADELGRVTGSVTQGGQPYRSTIAGDGSGLTTGILDAVRALVGDTRRDITVIAEDNPSTPGVDESRFVSQVVATICPTVGINNCLGGQGTDTCEDCLAESVLSFEFRVGNDFVASTGVDQVFDFDLVSVADGSVELNRIPVRVMVPAAGAEFGTGFYQNTYDSSVICTIPPERPDWDSLTWTGSTPGDSEIEFEFFTAESVEELENQIPVSAVVDDSMGNVIDVRGLLVSEGRVGRQIYLKVRARLQASTDLANTPVLSGWSMQFNCYPAD
ncbi:MAG: vWA domain-containing protein [Polyangiales bacterium]